MSEVVPAEIGDLRLLTGPLPGIGVDEVVLDSGGIPSAVGISSPGGDAVEAMKIGRFIRKNHLAVMPIQPCDSACTFIVFAAVKRGDGKLGLHRPYYDPQYFSKLSGEAASKEYKKLDGEVRKYLIDMNVPTLVIDKIMSIPSSNVEYMDTNVYNKLAGETPPAHNEWLAARCGPFTESERQDYKYASAFILNEKDPDADPGPLANEMFKYHVEEARKLSPSYREHICNKGKKIINCEEETIEQERLNNFSKLRNMVNNGVSRQCQRSQLASPGVGQETLQPGEDCRP
jgi:hypothetical protein